MTTINGNCRGLITILFGHDHRSVEISSDGRATYATMYTGMVGEGILEVGYSSINGSPKPAWEMWRDCIEYIQERVTDSTFDSLPNNRKDWLQFLLKISEHVDSVYQEWLGFHQDAH